MGLTGLALARAGRTSVLLVAAAVTVVAPLLMMRLPSVILSDGENQQVRAHRSPAEYFVAGPSTSGLRQRPRDGHSRGEGRNAHSSLVGVATISWHNSANGQGCRGRACCT
jgi:hypothetical protein